MNNNLIFKKELFRKYYHLLALFIPYFYYKYGYANFTYFIMTFSAIIILFDILRLNFTKIFNIYLYLFESVSREYEKSSFMSSTIMIISFLIITFIFDYKIVITAMLIGALSDTAAAVIGLKYGKITIINNKTFEGFIMFALSTYLIIVFMNFNYHLIILLFLSISISMIELLTKTKYDNFTIPIFSSIILKTISYL